MYNYRHQIPNLVADIYREVLKLACEGNDIFFSFDSKYKLVEVRGYRGRFTTNYKGKPAINELVTYESPSAIRGLQRKLKEVYKFRKEEPDESDTTVEENLESE